VLALDTDPVAVHAAGRNVRRNRPNEQVEVRQGTLEPGMGPFDLILANLLARTLREMAGLLAAALAPGGVLIGSGVLVEQAEEVAAAFAAAGLHPIEQPVLGDWVALVAGR
jgi:ribosomal protein L11 methyltransferase